MNQLLTVLVSPTPTFERLRDKGGWLPAFIVIVILSLLVVWLQWPAIEAEMERSFEQQGLEVTEQMKLFSAVSAYASGVIAIVAMIFIGGLLLMLVNWIVRGEASYMQLVKVFLYSTVASVLGGLVTGVLVRATGAEDIRDVTLSLGMFLEEKKGIVYSLANLVNPFTIWYVALMVIGSAVMMRKSRSKVAVWIVGGWIVFSLVGGMPFRPAS